MKATSKYIWTKLITVKQIQQKALEEMKEKVKDQKAINKVRRKVRKFNFPCELQFDCSGTSVSFFPPAKGWKDDKEFHSTLASIVRQFGVKLERKFSEYSREYFWTGRGEKDFGVTLYGALTPENCEVVEYQETSTVTKYKSICGKGA